MYIYVYIHTYISRYLHLYRLNGHYMYIFKSRASCIEAYLPTANGLWPTTASFRSPECARHIL